MTLNFCSGNDVNCGMPINFIFTWICVFTLGSACKGSTGTVETWNQNQTEINMNRLDTATFGAGCFWCVEAIFERVKGVEKVVSGYSGGQTVNPTYKEVTSGLTGHAEVCQLFYDPEIVTFDELLEIFWQTHDPTTLNRQGADVGTQYRSAVFWHNEAQRERAAFYKEQFNKEHVFGSPVVTEITPFTNFYKAEDYHQDYFLYNANQPYCRAVVAPKVEKFEKLFRDKLKK
jgi:peptide-methionine (S)-S-oxide reductase